MPAGNMQLAIQITAEGRVDQVVRKITEQLKPLGASLSPVSAQLKEGERNLGQWSGHLREVRTSITDTARKFAEIAPPLAALGGLASVGGIGAAVYQTARWGRGLEIAAQSLAILPPRLQSLQGAALLGGSSVDAMTGSLSGLQAKLHGAAWGRDAAAIGFFKQIGAVRDGFDKIRNAADVLPEIADAVQRQTDPYVQSMILMEAGIDVRLLPAMLRGRKGLAELQDRFKFFGYEVTTEGRAALSILDQGFLDLGVAVNGTVQSLSVELAPAVTGIVNEMAQWLAINRGWLGEKVHEGIDLITTALKGVDWPGAARGAREFGTALVPVGEAVGTIVKGLAWMAAHPTLVGAVTGAVVGSRFGPVGAVVGGVAGMTAGSTLGGSEQDEAGNEALARWNREHSLGQDPRSFGEFKSQFDRARPQSAITPPIGPQSAITPPVTPASFNLGGLNPISPAEAAPMPGFGPPANWQGPAQSATAEAPNDQRNNWASMRARGGGWQSFETPEAGVRATRDLLGRYASGAATGHKLDTLQDIIGTWAPPGENQTETLIARAERQLAIGRAQHMNMGDPETMRRLVSVMIANEHGGVLPKGAPQGMIDKALGFGGAPPGGGVAPGLAPSGMTGSGAYGVPGAVMNYGSTGALGAAGTNLVQIAAPDGRKFTVNRAAAGAFQGFVSELEAQGYKIDSIGGYNYRNKTGGGSLSEHAYGTAIDINPGRNAYGGTATDLPKNIHDLAAKYGLVWGGDWKSSPDPMHFQWGGPNAGLTGRGSPGDLAGSTIASRYRSEIVLPSPLAPRYRPETAAPPVEQRGAEAAPAPEIDTSGIAAAAQSRHQLEVSFINAPAGMRSGLKAANGPADLAVRTEFAMSGPS